MPVTGNRTEKHVNPEASMLTTPLIGLPLPTCISPCKLKENEYTVIRKLLKFKYWFSIKLFNCYLIISFTGRCFAINYY